MDSRTAWRMDTAERTNNTIPQDRQHNPAGQTAYTSRSNKKKSSRTNNIKTSIRK